MSARQWVPLACLAAIAVLTFWASVALWAPSPLNSATRPHIPDVSIENFSARKLDRQGAVQYALHAANLVHYDDDGSAHARDVRFVANMPGKPQLAAQAPYGMLRKGQGGEEEVELSGGVKAQSTAMEKYPATQLTTPDLVLFPDTLTAHANRGVVLVSNGSHVKADRMVLDGDAGKVQLSNAMATLERARR
jgi:lipopolysaccharide export system protein LptC